MSALDPRLNAFRDDLADIRLEGRVNSARFVEGRRASIAAPVMDLKSRPAPDAGIDTQLLCGETVLIFEELEGWAWVQAERDGYVGYASADALAAPSGEPTHVVVTPRTFVYPGPELKMPPVACHSMGALLNVVDFTENRGTRYARLGSGEAVIARHLQPADWQASDFVGVAEALLHTPYLWGGTSAFGIDCSGIVQLSLRLTGRLVLRNTDMQAGSIGEPLDVGSDLSGLQRGDLVFWKGHVGIMRDQEVLLHANGHSMTVASEPLREAVERIAHLYGRPTGFRRP
ncbi:MAG: NlpC/P60 family protein [Mesorhizobium sp.]|nr:NlpC/P60 family protein [Mesorhizobium sp.]